MSRVYAVGFAHEKVTKNPVFAVEISTTSEYEAIVIPPPQTVAILGLLANNLLHFTLVLTCAATALRASEIVALRWSDIRWDEGRIRISKRWAKGKDGKPKTDASDDYVPMHPVLALSLKDWQRKSPYSKSTDFVFPSIKCKGKVPLSPSTFVADHLRPAAKLAGVVIAEGERFGFHNLRHSLSNWLVNKRKENPKTVQGILRHGRIQTTLDLYSQSDLEEMQKAQGAFLGEMGFATGMVQ
jgi:integrase